MERKHHAKMLSGAIKLLIFNMCAILIFSFVYWLLAQWNDTAFDNLSPDDNFINYIYFTTSVSTNNRFDDSIKPLSDTARGIVIIQQLIILFELFGAIVSFELFSFRPYITFFKELGKK